MTIKRTLFAIGLLGSIACTTQAQNLGLSMQSSAERARLDKWSAGFSLGTSPFLGDIHTRKELWPSTELKNEITFAGAINVQRYIVPIFALQAQALFGTLVGAKASDNDWFRTPYQIYSMNGIINFK